MRIRNQIHVQITEALTHAVYYCHTVDLTPQRMDENWFASYSIKYLITTGFNNTFLNYPIQ
jgi:hypothetical protein